MEMEPDHKAVDPERAGAWALAEQVKEPVVAKVAAKVKDAAKDKARVKVKAVAKVRAKDAEIVNLTFYTQI